MPRLTLAQQIAQLEQTEVSDYDPEDAYNITQPTGIDNAGMEMDEEDGAREHYVEVGPSSLRKIHDSVSDPKYAGVKASRRKIFDDDEDSASEHDAQNELENGNSDDDEDDDMEETPGGDDDEDPGYQPTHAFGKYKVDEDEELDEAETEDEDEDEEEEDEEVDDDDGADEKEDFDHSVRLKSPEEGDKQLADALRRTREQDRAKGKAVARQLATWDSLLDSRIRIQKSVVAANKLPLPDKMDHFISSTSAKDAVDGLLDACLDLSGDLFKLQETYLINNEEIEVPPRKKRKLNDRNARDYEAEVKDASVTLAQLQASYHKTLLQTLSKWSQKVQAVAPSALSGTSFKNSARNLPGHQKGAVELVEETLSGGKAVSRTRIRRAGDGSRVGGESAAPAGLESLDADEVFDDTDFYQQLLRDVIDSRTNKDSQGVDAADAWARKQKRAQKAEKALGNKERRVKYDVHEKLQSFMVPVPVSRGAWHEEQIDELFSSLLGKGFEDALREDLQPPEASIPKAEADMLAAATNLGGFKVF